MTIQKSAPRHLSRILRVALLLLPLSYAAMAVDTTAVSDEIPLVRKERHRTLLEGPPLWRLLVGSTYIAKGILHVPTAEMQKVLRSGKGDYLDLRIEAQDYLKAPAGFEVQPIKIRYFCEKKTTSYQPPVSKVRELDGKVVIAFLHKTTEKPQFGNGEIYFASHSAESLQSFDEALERQVREELARQKAILTSPEQRYDAKRDPLYPRVKGIITRMTVASEQHKAFADLERLGQPAVPAIIALMDDRRDLAEKRISLENKSPGAFEGLRHYNASKVIDALDAILNQLTGLALGTSYFDDSDAARVEAVNAWRVYRHYLLEPEDQAQDR